VEKNPFLQPLTKKRPEKTFESDQPSQQPLTSHQNERYDSVCDSHSIDPIDRTGLIYGIRAEPQRHLGTVSPDQVVCADESPRIPHFHTELYIGVNTSLYLASVNGISQNSNRDLTRHQ